MWENHLVLRWTVMETFSHHAWLGQMLLSSPGRRCKKKEKLVLAWICWLIDLFVSSSGQIILSWGLIIRMWKKLKVWWNKKTFQSIKEWKHRIKFWVKIMQSHFLSNKWAKERELVSWILPNAVHLHSWTYTCVALVAPRVNVCISKNP